MIDKDHQLINDRAVANLLSVSCSWMRKERFNRRHGLPHVFDLDPVMIGSTPRYILEEVLAWIEVRSASRSPSKRRAAE